MSAWKTLLLALFPALAGGQAERLSTRDPLVELQWRDRLVIGAPRDAEEAEAILKEVRAFEEMEPNPWKERKLRLFLVLPEGDILSDAELPADPEQLFPALTSRLPNRDGHRFSLIGLDGGIKDMAEKPTFQQWFDQIDAMPMRIREMQEEGR